MSDVIADTRQPQAQCVLSVLSALTPQRKERCTVLCVVCTTKHVALTDLHYILCDLPLPGRCSCPKVFGFGACLPVRATPSSWLMGTASSRSCCTVACSKSQGRSRAGARASGRPAERRVPQSGPPCCPSAWRFVRLEKHNAWFSFQQG